MNTEQCHLPSSDELAPAHSQLNQEQSNNLSQELQDSLMAAVQDGLPLTTRPFLTLGKALGVGERQVIDTLQHWQDNGRIKRLGLVVNHKNIGYTANAMVVWDIADNQVDTIGKAIKESGLVTLCYRRPRRLPEWSYNLFCMIHGRDRSRVMEVIESLCCQVGLEETPRRVLFSTRQFKQRGGHYAPVASHRRIATQQETA